MRLFLMLDYDGTLTPIRHHPNLAILSPKRRSLLRKLARRPGVKLAVISGRKLSSVKKMVGIRNIIYVGNHGLEIEAGGRRWTHPAARKAVPLLKEIKKALNKAARPPRTFVEDKGLTLSVHYRLLAKNKAPVFLKDLARRLKTWGGKIKVTHGKKVVEIRPPVDWDKGKAVKWLINKLRLDAYFPVYIGDDRTDEDAFRALRGVGFSLKVGKGGRSRADDRLGGVADVYRFLSSCARQREEY